MAPSQDPDLDIDVSVDPKEPARERLRAIARSVQHVYDVGVEGDIAEFGIARGTSFTLLAAMIEACERPGVAQSKKLRGFDSFRGLPAATGIDRDLPMVTAGKWAQGRCNSPGEAAILTSVQRHLPLERVFLYPGWFSETLPLLDAGEKFALVHLDCDLYQSTADVLTDLFRNDRLSDGCLLLFDDFLENRASPDLGQRRAWEECKREFAPRFTDLGFYGRASWRCIVHRSG